jgi:transcriptional regulator with XRE-family HTH domain
MINNSEFADRLLKIMEYNQLSASAFADRIHVQRSSISHLLSGRNKPSLDFVMKVIKEFEEVELYWLLNGKGSYPATVPAPTFEKRKGSDVKTQAENTMSISSAAEKNAQQDKHERAIERIVVFYSDGTFKSYAP